MVCGEFMTSGAFSGKSPGSVDYATRTAVGTPDSRQKTDIKQGVKVVVAVPGFGIPEYRPASLRPEPGVPNQGSRPRRARAQVSPG